jgi:hypothetical protein
MTIAACKDCAHRTGYGRTVSMCGRFPPRFDKIEGWMGVQKTCDFERSRFWRWFGRDTCGPEARFFQPISELRPPTGGSAVRKPPRPSR